MQRSVQYLVLLTGFLLASCAQIVAPVGGDKDTTPPQLIEAMPANASVNFNESSVQFSFDEYVQLNDVQNQLIISPPLKDRPKITQRKKTIVISWEEALQPNTTYTFDFGDAIADVNEGNVAELKYVCSTGPQLDSLSLSGRVLHAFTNEPVSGAKVMLYATVEDSLPLKEKPLYFTRTNEDGFFTISYLKTGAYKLFALKEQIGNYLYDELSEEIAFYPGLIAPWPSDSLASLHAIGLSMAREDNEPQYISDYRTDSAGWAVLALNRFSRSIKLESPNSTALPPVLIQAKKGDSLRLWFEGTPVDRIVPVIVKDDSLVLDTLEVPFFNGLSRRPLELSCGQGAKFDAKIGIEIESLTRLLPGDTSRLVLLEDSLPIPAYLVPDTADLRRLKVKAAYRDGHRYDLRLDPGAVSTPGYAISDTLNCNLFSFSAEHFGNFMLELEVPSSEQPYVLQIEDPQGKVVYSFVQKENAVHELKRMLPGTYTLRVIHDLNYNGEWTGPDYFKSRQPEQVFIYPQQVIVRSNWDQKITWKIQPNGTD